MSDTSDYQLNLELSDGYSTATVTPITITIDVALERYPSTTIQKTITVNIVKIECYDWRAFEEA